MSEYRLKREDAHRKYCRIEVNFKERIIVKDSDLVKQCSEEVWNGIVVAGLGQDWHDVDRDELEYFMFWSDGTYAAQKRRLRTDSETGNTYWKAYGYKDATAEEAERAANIFSSVFTLQTEERRTNWVAESQQLFDRQFYYEAKWTKFRKQISEMLLYSDWRMLADYEEEFDGELELWKEWRRRLRTILPDFDTFDTPFDAFKYVSTMKYPIDPNIYVEKYPNRDVEYLSTDDQFDKLDFKVSTDFVAQNLVNIADFVRNWQQEEIVVTQAQKALMEELDMYRYFPDLNASLIKAESNPIPEEMEQPDV